MSQPQRLLQNTCSLHEWEGLRSQLLFAFERPIPDGQADGAYIRRAQYGAVLIRRGWYEMESEGKRLTAQPGQWMFSFTERHRQRFSHDAYVLALRMTNAWSDETPLFVASQKLVMMEAAKHPAIESLAVQLVAGLGPVELHPENPIFTYRQRTRLDLNAYAQHQKLMMDWLTLMAQVLPSYGVTLRYPQGMDTRLVKAIDAIEGLSPGGTFPRSQVERTSGLTIQQLDRLCRQSFDMTTRQYWDRHRLQTAKFELRRTASSIKEIALALGFVQLSHFSAWFKRHAGISPRAYRDTQQAEPGR